MKKSTPAPTQAAPDKKPVSWLKISVIVNIVVVAIIAGGVGGLVLLHQSDTNPMLCRSCHVMESHVDSYLTSSNLDNAGSFVGK